MPQVLQRDRLAAVVVVEIGLAVHDLFKGPVAAGSELHRPSPLSCFWTKEKPQTFFKICGLVGEQKRACHACEHLVSAWLFGCFDMPRFYIRKYCFPP